MNDFEEQFHNNDLRVLDVREKWEYDSGHIKGAVNLPLSSLESSSSKLDNKDKYYIVCRSGARSATATDYLAQLGYDTTNVAGGMLSWNGTIITK